jgi:hypothetical protein
VDVFLTLIRLQERCFIEPFVCLSHIHVTLHFCSISASFVVVFISLTASIREVFLVFHDKGYTVYEPNHCHVEHQVLTSFSNIKFLPEYGDTVRTLCEQDGCSWGTAVNVKNQYIYISQPTLHRVIVIEITERNNPVEVGWADPFTNTDFSYIFSPSAQCRDILPCKCPKQYCPQTISVAHVSSAYKLTD